MNKSCENCKYFESTSVRGMTLGSWCAHEDHKGMYVPKFTSCPEYELKDTKTTPFDGVKFYLIDSKTGEIGIKYICEDCGKIMDKPDHWWLKVPYGNAVPKDMGYHFRCEECYKKKEGEV